MHQTNHSRFRKAHDFVPDFSHAERRTRIVIGITAVMMVVEIAVGLMSRSMALLADGWHMSTHVIAFVITAAALGSVRRNSDRDAGCTERFLTIFELETGLAVFL